MPSRETVLRSTFAEGPIVGLLLADLHEALARHVGRRGAVRSGFAAGDAHGHDVTARARPLRERPRQRELLLVGMGGPSRNPTATGAARSA